ncbi:MAG: shikimate dehydrogenase [Methanothrix sp.]|uniref:shikimate dehydrogenase n=1 Tax=Methanothrix sp. TaxID=90426 RepID=UPI003BB79EEC
MKIFGIFGDPIEHSLSPAMQNAAFRALGMDGCYHAFRVSRSRLKDAVIGADAMGFGGLNLTIPLKEEALSLDFLEADDLARAIGAVNTISFSGEAGEKKGKNRIQGHNTDGWGALLALQDAGVKVKGSRVLLIGAGGGARAIAYALDREGAEVSIANRNLEKAHELAASVGGMGYCLCDLERLVGQADVIINATSVGMREGDGRIIDGRLLKSRHVVFDIVYNRETELLRDARSVGAVAIDGVMMLVYQGARAFEIWTGRKAPVDVMERTVRESLEERRQRESRG